MNLDKRIEVEKEKLNILIEKNADYKLILKQSQKLDELIVEKMKEMRQ